MNENIETMLAELKREFPEDFGSYDGLTVEAIDLEGRYDNFTDFDETLLDEIVISYKNRTISIKRWYRNDWEIHDEDYIKFEDFREVGKILNIVIKHISRIELD